MAEYYKLSGTTNRHTDWTTEVVLEADEQGNPTKVARMGEPSELSAEDRNKLESLGYTLEESSKSEFEEVRAGAASAAGGDVAGAAPLLGDSEQANQSTGAEEEESSQTRSTTKRK